MKKRFPFLLAAALVLAALLCAGAFAAADSGLLAGWQLEPWTLREGYTVPVLPASDMITVTQDGDKSVNCLRSSPNFPYRILVEYTTSTLGITFWEDAESAMEVYAYFDNSANPDYQAEYPELDGHPAMICVCRRSDNGRDYSYGVLYYTRNNTLLRIRVYSYPNADIPYDDLPKVTMDDMRILAEGIAYDPSRSTYTLADGDFTVASKDGSSVLAAGKKLAFTAVFPDPEKIAQYKPYSEVTWSVTGPDGAAAPEGVTIDAKGNLSAAKTVAEVLDVEVRAESAVFRTSAVFPVRILPVLKGLSLEPAELFFYTGADASAEVKALPDPDTVPPVGITWTAAKQGIVDITPDADNGTAVFRPLAAGKTTVAVKEPGGKTAKLTVSVVAPVESLELSARGKAVPGGTVTVKETLLPKQAGNKAVEWSLDVGEDVATVSKGKVKIAKGVPAGTVITVTCTALGAPEPVTASLRITVE